MYKFRFKLLYSHSLKFYLYSLKISHIGSTIASTILFYYIWLMNVPVTLYYCALVVAICNLLLTSVLVILFNDKKQQANWLLPVLLLFLGVSFLSDLLIITGFFDVYPHFYDYDTFLTLSLGPLLFLYIRLQTRPDQKLSIADGLHMLSILFYILLLKDFFFSDAATKRIAIANRSISNYELASYFVKIQLLIYGLACYRMLLRHNHIVEDVFSTPDNLRLTWLRHLLIAAALLFTAWVTSNLFYSTLSFNGNLLNMSILLFSYWIAYKALKQGWIFDKLTTAVVLPILQEVQPEQRYKNSKLTQETIAAISTQLVKFMDETKPYLDPALSLTSLSTLLNVNPNHLSQVLNEGFNQNFYNFVNRYRVEESKRLLLDPKFAHYSILGIASEAGFNSKSTFNKVFRDVVRLTPSQYVSEQRVHNSGNVYV